MVVEDENFSCVIIDIILSIELKKIDWLVKFSI